MTNFLSLPRELRQQILLNALEDDDLVQKGLEFNRLLLEITNNERIIDLWGKGFSFIPIGTVFMPLKTPLLDDPFIFVPTHTVTLAVKLSTVDTQVAEDMGWVVKTSLRNLARKALPPSPEPPSHAEKNRIFHTPKHAVPLKSLFRRVEGKDTISILRADYHNRNMPGFRDDIGAISWRAGVGDFGAEWSRKTAT